MEWSCVQVEHHLPSYSVISLSSKHNCVTFKSNHFPSDFKMMRWDTLIHIILGLGNLCACHSKADLVYSYWSKGINTKTDTWGHVFYLCHSLYSSSKSENLSVHRSCPRPVDHTGLGESRFGYPEWKEIRHIWLNEAYFYLMLLQVHNKVIRKIVSGKGFGRMQGGEQNIC